MAICDFPKKWVFYPKSKKKLKLLYNFLQNPKFSKFSKNLQHVVEPCLDIRHAKFQVDMSIFGKHIAQKPYPLMTSFFQTVIWSISRHRTVIKMTFLEFWNQTGSETHIFTRKKIHSKIWSYVTRGWSDPSLSLTCMESDCKMASSFEFYVQKWL